MSKKWKDNGPTFSQSPLQRRLPRQIIPTPEQRQAELDQAARDAAKSRSFHQLRNKVGLGEALGILSPREPIKRRV